MVPGLVPEISSLDAFCDGAGAGGAGAGGAGIGDSRSWIQYMTFAIISRRGAIYQKKKKQDWAGNLPSA